MQHLFFSFWFTSLCMTVPTSIHVSANVTVSLLFMAEEYFMVYKYHIFFIRFSVDGHLGCFYVLTIVNDIYISLYSWYDLTQLGPSLCFQSHFLPLTAFHPHFTTLYPLHTHAYFPIHRVFPSRFYQGSASTSFLWAFSRIYKMLCLYGCLGT